MRKLAALAFAMASLALFAERDTAIYRGKLTSDMNANGNRITDVASPSAPGDAANKEYVDSHGGGGGSTMTTNVVIDIANTTIATNPVVAAKLDGPTVAPTNTAEAAGKAADAQKTGIALTNRYTKAEMDERLAGKVTLNAEESQDGWIDVVGNITSSGGSGFFYGSVEASTGDIVTYVRGGLQDNLSAKANRPSTYTPGNIAALDENGDLVDSGKTVDDFLPIDGGTMNGDVDMNYRTIGNAVITSPSVTINGTLDIQGTQANFDNSPISVTIADVTVTDGDVTADGHSLKAKADRSMIHHTNATFSNEVLKVQMLSLSTNITAEVYIAATNACANLGIDPSLIPQGGTLGTVGGLIVALAAAVALLRKKTKLLKSDGTAEDDFAADLLGKQVAKEAMAYKVATASGENRSVLVVEIAETATAAVNVVVPAPVANRVIDFEVWVKVAARSTDIPQINYGYMADETFTPVTLIKKGGENPAYEKDATLPVTNIVHFTSTDASGYTVVAAAFK